MNIREYLSSLGNSSEEVAESLRKQGVKGYRKSVYACPILQGIYKACPNYWSGLEINGGIKNFDGSWRYRASLHDSQIVDPTLPQPIMNFIGDFDTGKYPDLES